MQKKLFNMAISFFIIAILAGCGNNMANQNIGTPENLAAKPQLTATNEPAILLTWSQVESAASYKIYFKIDEADIKKGAKDVLTITVEGTKLSFLHKTDIQLERPYYYAVSALDKNGEESELSNEVREVPTLFLPAPPAVPTGVEVDNRDSFLVISWVDQEGVDSYDIYWGNFDGLTTGNGILIENVSNPYRFESSLEMGQIYVFAVLAKNREGSSGLSAEVKTEANLVPRPHNIQAANRRNKIRISWDDDALPGDTFNLYWGRQKGITIASSKIADITSPYIHEIDFASQSPDTVYYYRLTRDNDIGESKTSDEVSTTPRIIVPPENLIVTGTGEGVKINWQNAPITETYNIYWDTKPGISQFDTPNSAEGVEAPYFLEQMKNGVDYYFAVTSVNRFGESEESREIASRADIITAPEITSISKDFKGFSINWDTTPEAGSYNLYWSKTETVSKVDSNRIENVSSGYYMKTGLVYDETFYFALTFKDTTGESALSTIQKVELDHVFPIDQLANSNSLTRIFSSSNTFRLRPRAITLIDDVVYFIYGNIAADNLNLGRTNSTPEGTDRLAESQMHKNEAYQGLVKYDNRIYFTAGGNDTEHGFELWSTDGTRAGTSMFKDINSGKDSSIPVSFTEAGGLLYFMAQTNGAGLELWRTDGTITGTQMVRDIAKGTESSTPYGLVGYNGKLIFFADDKIHGVELWISDGSEAGTFLVQDINGTGSGSIPSDITKGVVVGSRFYFVADTDRFGRELWVYDDDNSNINMVKDIWIGKNSASIKYLTAYGNKLYFTANNKQGSELWMSDGTKAGTVMVADIFKGRGGSFVKDLILFDNRLFFEADDGTTTGAGQLHGFDLWVTDNATGKTEKFLDANPGSASIEDYLVTTAGNEAMMIAAKKPSGLISLWSSDGSKENTMMINSNFSTVFTQDTFRFFKASDKIYFTGINTLSNSWQILAIIP